MMNGTLQIFILVTTMRFLIVDGDKSKMNTFGIAGKYGTSSLTNVIDRVLSFDRSLRHAIRGRSYDTSTTKLSESDRSMVTSYLMSKWDISSSSASTSCTESSIGKSDERRLPAPKFDATEVHASRWNGFVFQRNELDLRVRAEFNACLSR